MKGRRFYVPAQVFDETECGECKGKLGYGAKGSLVVLVDEGLVTCDSFHCLRCIGQRPVGQQLPMSQMGMATVAPPVDRTKK